MKYKYAKTAYLSFVFGEILLAVVLLWYFYSKNGDIKWIKKMLITLTGYLTVFLSLASPEYLNRFVEFHDDYVVFNSFRIPRKGVKSFNVKYEDILRLDATVIPIIGIYKVKVKCNNVPWNIPVTWCMSRHNELFSKLCSYAEEHNPNVNIDERLIEILEKKGYRETD